jgi:2-C-methyl-D-erythritol 4-phosphate cytidylyltransferase
MREYVIITAGGSGTRMGNVIPKQFLPLAGRPILQRSIAAFYNYNKAISIILVLPEANMEYWNSLCLENNFDIPHTIVAGGKERFHSIKNGLAEIEGAGVVAVHDGVRPLVSTNTIKAAFDTAKAKGNAIPVVDISESVREVNESGNKAVNRANFKRVQTPQCFDLQLLQKAYKQPYSASFTDDSSVVEAIGETIHLVAGNVENIKITTPADLASAEALLQHQ